MFIPFEAACDLPDSLSVTPLPCTAGDGANTAAADSDSQATSTGESGSSDTDYGDNDYYRGDFTTEQIISSMQFMYTSQSEFGAGAMQRLVREPALDLISSDADVAADVMVRCVSTVGVIFRRNGSAADVL